MVTTLTYHDTVVIKWLHFINDIKQQYKMLISLH